MLRMAHHGIRPASFHDFPALTRAQWIGFWRDKQNWFWLLLFPLMFLFLFGFLFQDSGASRSTIAIVGDIQFIKQMPPEAHKQFDQLFKTKAFKSQEAAIQEVRSGKLDGALVEEGATLKLYYSAADQVTSATVRGTMDGFVNGANQALSKQPPTFTLATDQVEDNSLKPIQYTAPGLLGWAVAMGGIFNTVNPSVYESRTHGVPAKQAYLKKDLADWARHEGVDIRFPPSIFPINSVKAMRACCWLLQQDGDGQRMEDFAEAVFQAYWTHDRDIAQDSVLADIAKAQGIDAVMSICDRPLTLDACMSAGSALIESASERLCRIVKAVRPGL